MSTVSPQCPRFSSSHYFVNILSLWPTRKMTNTIDSETTEAGFASIYMGTWKFKTSRFVKESTSLLYIIILCFGHRNIDMIWYIYKLKIGEWNCNHDFYNTATLFHSDNLYVIKTLFIVDWKKYNSIVFDSLPIHTLHGITWNTKCIGF